jgi:dephospho-CoA kinase
VRREILARLEAARGAGRNVVLDVPLLLERGLIEACDRVLFVAVGDAARRARALARGMPEADWQQREASQAALADKQARADAVVDNSGDLAATERAVDAILDRWLAPG